MIDANLRPSLIEINQMPSFVTDSALDYRIKRGLIVDVLRTLCLSMKRKRKYKADRARRMTERLMMKPARVGEGGRDEAGGGKDRGDKAGDDGLAANLAAKRSSVARGEDERKAKAALKK